LTPLHLACLHQNKNIVEYVLQKCIDATKVHDRNRKHPFHLACNWDEHLPTAIMHSILNTFVDALLCKTNDNSLPLQYYVQSNPTSNNKLFFLT